MGRLDGKIKVRILSATFGVKVGQAAEVLVVE